MATQDSADKFLFMLFPGRQRALCKWSSEREKRGRLDQPGDRGKINGDWILPWVARSDLARGRLRKEIFPHAGDPSGWTRVGISVGFVMARESHVSKPPVELERHTGKV